MPAIFTTQGCDLTQFLGTREEGGHISGGGGNLISRIKRILGPFVLRRVKADVMKQLAAKEQKVGGGGEYLCMNVLMDSVTYD